MRKARTFGPWTILWLLLAAATWPGAAPAQDAGPVSDGTPPAVCDPGSFVTGIDCRGQYCDEIRFTCDRFPGAALGRATWTGWVSEEEGERRCPEGSLIAGFACRGSFCDDVSLYCVEVRNMREHRCGDTRFVSDEGRGRLRFGPERHGRMTFARGVRCDGPYCKSKSFNVCEVGRW